MAVLRNPVLAKNWVSPITCADKELQVIWFTIITLQQESASPISLSYNSEPNPTQPEEPTSAIRWSHLNQYERKYLKEAMRAYDRIILVTDDIPRIARRYQLSVSEVERAKDYAFGSGVVAYQFSPDIHMAEAWHRMASGQGNDLDEVLLRHEVFESDLVVNQEMSQPDAHNLAQARYPWSILITRQNYE